MKSRYLKKDPLPWLSDGVDSAVTMITLDEFGNSIVPADDLKTSAATHLYSEIQGRLKKMSKHDIDILYKGSLWNFLFASHCNSVCDGELLSEAASFISSALSSTDDGFSLNWRPPVSVACRTGEIVAAFLRTGSLSERSSRGLNWIASSQRGDGGWLHCPFYGISDSFKLFFLKKPGRGLEYEHDSRRRSCPVATTACALALIESGNSEYLPCINRAAEYFLSLKSFIEADSETLYCGQRIDFGKDGYPVMSQTGRIPALSVIFSSSLWNDKKGGRAFNRLMNDQDSNGRWTSAKSLSGIIKGPGADRWTTLSVMRLLNKLDKQERGNQLSKA